MLKRSRWTFLPLFLVLLSACADDDPALPSGPHAPAPVPRFTMGSGCKVNDSFERGLSATTDSINWELNDYGRVLADADDGTNLACVDSAANALRDKLNATLAADPNHYRNFFLDGALVALIFASADRIGANGGMTASLDSALQRTADAFGYPANADIQDSCELESTDNCMDGHSVAASGFGWIAAYRYARGLPGVATAQAQARQHIDSTFSSACISKGFGRTHLCDGTPNDLRADTAKTLSMNVGQQYPAYGFGLMTSVAAAELGLKASNALYGFNDDQKSIATGLFAETQRTVNASVSPNVFLSTCPLPIRVKHENEPDSVWADTGHVSCAGANYQPQMYALKAFYQQMGVLIPTAGGYTSDSFNAGHFDLGSGSRLSFFSWGRYETYGQLGDDWWRNPRAHMPRTDNYPPKGALDLISNARDAQGWACDPDMPSAAVRVVLSAPGQTPITFRTDQPNEQGVNDACGGGSGKHRFWVRLPASWVGLTVTETVVDYLGLRTSTVGCNMAGGCRVPAPATVGVVWVQPAYASWGQPNTLTAAGNSGGGTGGVQMLWRDASVNGQWTAVAWQPTPAADGTWSNTIPSSNYCHDYQVQANYSGTTSAVFTYHGLTAGYCPEAARVIWIQPQSSAGFGPAGSLVVAGQATGAPSGTGVTMWWRNVTAGGGWTQAPYVAPTDANGIWYNSIPNANYGQQYAVAVVYDVFNSQICTYAGTGSITWC